MRQEQGPSEIPQQMPLEFEGAPSYDVKKHIVGAICHGENGITQEDLDQDDNGNFSNARGDIFERIGSEYRLKEKAASPMPPELAAMEKIYPHLKGNRPALRAMLEVNKAPRKEPLDPMMR